MPFSRLGLFSSVVRATEAKGYEAPTPVQVETIPAVLTGRDVIACAQTGTGKTAAFALPIINRLGPHRTGGPRVLVLEPTRELATQVEKEFRDFAQFTDLQIALIQGGTGYSRTRAAALDATDIVVATVGRLLELLESRVLKLDQLKVLVLDEVDRMLDMGFIDDVRAIIERCPVKRQTLFFSATVPMGIDRLAKSVVRDPIRINVGRVRTVPDNVDHALYPVAQHLKFPLLLALLERTDFRSVIIFARTKQGADGIVARLKRAGHSATVLHGDRSPGQRKASLTGFKDGYYDVLVATDLAARGLDLTGVSHVVNYDIPLTPDDYVHRVGRTGRSDASGDAFTFFTPRESGAVQSIEKYIRTQVPKRKLDGFDYSAAPAAESESATESRAAGTPAAPKKPRSAAADNWTEVAIGVKKQRKPDAALPEQPSYHKKRKADKKAKEKAKEKAKKKPAARKAVAPKGRFQVRNKTRRRG